MAPAILIRPLSIQELSRVNDIDVSESGTIVYKQKGRQVEVTREEWDRPQRGEASWTRHIESWVPMLEEGGTAIGAFVGDGQDEVLVGIALLRPRLTKSMSQLAALFVSRDYRRLGVASRLTGEVVRLARESGALALYVSATPSESAVGFYSSQGFHATDQVNQGLFALEPEDIHMVKQL